MIDEKPGDVELLAENERHQFDAHLQRFRLDKRGAAELGVVGDGELVGAHAAGEDAEAQVADFYWPSQSRAEVRLNLGTEIVDIYQKRERNGDHNQQNNDDADNFENDFHEDTSYDGRGEKWIGNRAQFIKTKRKWPAETRTK